MLHHRAKLIKVLDGLMLATLLLTLAGWLFDPLRFIVGGIRVSISAGMRPFILLTVLMSTRLWVVSSLGSGGDDKRGAGLMAKLVLSLFMSTLFLAGMEMVLGWCGVPRGEAVFSVQGRHGESVNANGSMVSDPFLLWRFQPGTEFNGRLVNRLGFLGRQDVDVVKAHHVKRIVCMGDSCTAQGLPNYADTLHQLLQDDPVGGYTWEAFSVGVHGYSVWQGLRQYQRDIRPMQPDVVTIFFGWNDHWLAAQSDRERMALARGRLEAAVLNGLARKRMMHLFLNNQTDVADRRVLRVPPDEYAAGLRDLIDEIKRDGATPFVVTAPRAQTLSRRLVHAGHTGSVEEAIELHDRYANISRLVAEKKSVSIIDLAAVMSDPEHFMEDGIHFTVPGLSHVAGLMHAALEAYDFPSPETALRR